MYYTRDELARVPIYGEWSLRFRKYHTKTSAVRATVFLSHSHDDADVVNQAVEILGSQGVVVYVDWKDPTMPQMTSPDSATRLKSRIRECRKFVLLATNAALASRWVPWELGIADATNGIDHVAVLPVTEPPRAWLGSEYVGIYATIEKADNGVPSVFKPRMTTGVPVADWLRS